MADEEYAIYPLADCPWPGGVDLTAVTYDRSLELESDVVGITVGVLSTADKAIAPESEPTLELSVTPTRDVAVSPRSDFQAMYLNPTVTKDMWFALESEPEPMKLSPISAADLHIVGNSEPSEPSLFCDATLDEAFGAMTADVEGMMVAVERMVRSIFEPPPDAAISVLRYMSSEDAEIPLDGASLEAGVTTVLQVEILGTRLETYLIEFAVRTSDSAVPVIFKTSNGRPGGIQIVAMNSVASPTGTRQQLLAQVVLSPEDTLQFPETIAVFYEMRMSNRGFGEDYRIAPKRDRGDTGTFTIAVG